MFVAIFFFEMLLKMVAYGIKPYFANNWNVFDFVVVTWSIAAAVII
jgi:hypothetical protein